MSTNNHLTLAVAGSGKTQGVVDSCARADKAERVLVLTYTTSSQRELRDRVAALAGDHPRIDVSGWFAFLIGSFVRPFLPFLHRGRSVRGFDFKSPPQQYARVDDWSRYFNPDGHVRKVHLPQLATRLEETSQGAGIRRLERVYGRIFIDEVQDLCGYDLEMLTLLMRSRIPLEMVGDVRQAILATNDRERKNKAYMFMKIWDWFRAEEKAGRLEISQRCETWRCHPAIAGLADSLFGDHWGFEATVSLNSRTTEHDGIFLVRPEHVDAYIATYAPLSLRHSSNSGRNLDHLPLMNIGEAKGLGRERVLIVPTEPVKKFLSNGTPLEHQQAARLYVAITRAEQSVAIVLDRAGQANYPYWTPSV